MSRCIYGIIAYVVHVVPCCSMLHIPHMNELCITRDSPLLEWSSFMETDNENGLMSWFLIMKTVFHVYMFFSFEMNFKGKLKCSKSDYEQLDWEFFVKKKQIQKVNAFVLQSFPAQVRNPSPLWRSPDFHWCPLNAGIKTTGKPARVEHG